MRMKIDNVGKVALIALSLLAAASPAGARDSKFTREGRAPMYWMAYEQCYVTDKAIDEGRWKENIDWTALNLAPYGFDMVSSDGWVEGCQTVNANGYITKYNDAYAHDWKYWVDYIHAKGLKAGIYYNPMWMTRTAWAKNLPVVGSALHTKDLKGDTNFNTELFWVDSRKNGADAWIKGYVRYFVDLGFDFLRVDFLNNYEDNYGTEAYAQALKWISEAAGDDILVSLVMPNAKNWAENERLYGDMFRISNDVFGGGWDFISNRDRGIYHEGWPSWGNIFDGFVQRSVISRSEIMADGDFVRLNTCASDEEREFWLSLLAMAGSPLACADQYDTARGSLRFYQNPRVNALFLEGFHGKPLSSDVADVKSQTWWGKAANGDIVVGLFNREEQARDCELDLAEVGMTRARDVINVWTGENIGSFDGKISIKIIPHSCRLLRFHPQYTVPEHLYMVGDATPGGWDINNITELTARGNGIFEWSGHLNDGELKFPFEKNGKFETEYFLALTYNALLGAPGNDRLVYMDNRNGNTPDYKFRVRSGDYTLRVDANVPSLTVSGYEPATAEVSQVYIIGSPLPNGWDKDRMEQMTHEGNGVYTWSGTMGTGDFKFLTTNDWSPAIHPACEQRVAANELEEVPAVFNHPGDSKVYIDVPGDYTVRLNTSAMTLSVKKGNAAQKGVYMLGSAVDKWDSSDPANVWYKNGEYMWFGNLTRTTDNKLVKFCTTKGPWHSVEYLIPADVDYNGNVRLISPANEYRLQRSSEAGGGVKDWFFGLNPDSPDGVYSLYIDPDKLTMRVDSGDTTGVEDISADTAAETVAVYDLSGRRVNPGYAPSGLYIRRLSNGKVSKFYKR